MRSSVTAPTLLENLASKLGLLYLSDLQYGKVPPHQLAETLKQFDPKNYSCAQWNDTIEYLTGKRENFATAEAAYAFLLQFLETPLTKNKGPLPANGVRAPVK